MNEGKISVRYARAVYNYALNNGKEDLVYREMSTLSNNLIVFAQEFKTAFAHPNMTDAKKIELYKIAAGKDISIYTSNAIEFVVAKKRCDYMARIALMYETIYQKEHNILKSHITCAIEPDDEIIKKMKDFIGNLFGADIDMTYSVNPFIIGGFILEVDHQRLDASIKGKIETLKKTLKTKVK